VFRVKGFLGLNGFLVSRSFRVKEVLGLKRF